MATTILETAMPRITNSRCVLAVRDLATSTRFYMDVLGFGRDFGSAKLSFTISNPLL